MLDFFITKDHPIKTPTKFYSRFDYLRRRYRTELNNIITYYRKRDRAVNNTNIFSRLISILSPSLDLDIVTYFKYVDLDAPYIARQFHLTSNISKGKVFENIFYRNNSYVIINEVTSDINLLELETNWVNRTPLRVIYSNDTDLDFNLLDGKKACSTPNLTIVELDIVLMLMMYRQWCKLRLHNDRSTNPNVFVYKVLIPNTLLTSIDINVFNRYKSLFYNESIREFDNMHPFHVIDRSKGIDAVLTEVINDTKGRGIPVEQTLRMIPAIVNKTMLDALYINKPYYTRQSEWSLWISRLKWIVFLMDVMGERGIARNRHLLYRLPSKIKELENRSTDLYNILPNDLIVDFNRDIEQIKNRIGRR